MAGCCVREGIAEGGEPFMSSIIFLLRFPMMLSTTQEHFAFPVAAATAAPTQLAMEQEIHSQDKRSRTHS